MTFSNALSKAFGSSDASTLRAVSTKRAWRSASVSLGAFGFDFLRVAMPVSVPQSND